MYHTLALLFFLSLLFGIFLLAGFIFKPQIWKNNIKLIRLLMAIWFVPYFSFIILFTGPRDLSLYPPKETSPWKLPWKGGVTRFVAQGNRSFTSHRAEHEGAWDFVMPIGTEVLAARGGQVIEVESNYDGIGYYANFVAILHEDGTRSVYAHLKKDGVLVKTGEFVQQGQAIALSGMVGQAPGPHLHFYVTDKTGTKPVFISFRDVPGNGIPLAAHFYESGNAN